MADNPIAKLPLSGQLGVAAVLAAAIGGAFWYLYWSPAKEEEQQKTTERDALREDIRRLEVTASRLEEFKREVAIREAKLETLKRILPPEKETPDLMRKVQYLASESSLQIKRFTPGATVPKEFYQEYPINVDVEGNFHNLALFFDRVGRLSRLVNVGNIKVKSLAKQTAASTIGVSCTATTYVYVETPLGPPPGQPGARR